MKRFLLPLVSILTCCTLILSSCRPNQPKADMTEGDTIQLRHARLIHMIEKGDHLFVSITNPWDTSQILAEYTFSASPSLAPEEIAIPLKRSAVFSSVHCALLQQLGCEQAIAAICDLEYCHLDFVAKGLQEGSIVSLGNSMDPSVEYILHLQPDALLFSPYENNASLSRVLQTGIPLIYCADYMEPSPLARAEWIRFYGRLYGQGEKADSLFDTIEQEYDSLKQQAATTAHKPRVLVEMPFGGEWLVPGGESTSGIFYKDAGGDYIFKDLPNRGSNSLSMEYIIPKALDADVWIIKHHGPLTRRQLFNDVPLLRSTSARIFLCNTVENGFYEEVPFRPQLYLGNLIALFHPELGISPEKNYFSLLK